MPTHSEINKKGIFLAIFSYSCWGLLPAYWKLLQHVPSVEVVLHRLCWAALFVSLLVTLKGRWSSILQIATNFRLMLLCISAGSVLSFNWFIYIWAVNSGFVLESSLGYFIVPLVNILFGVVFFKERLSDSQKIAVVLALIAVSYLTISLRALPW
ncbi:MAG: EamA family transporter, partial [Minisyncoccia bacterium]